MNSASGELPFNLTVSFPIYNKELTFHVSHISPGWYEKYWCNMPIKNYWHNSRLQDITWFSQTYVGTSHLLEYRAHQLSLTIASLIFFSDFSTHTMSVHTRAHNVCRDCYWKVFLKIWLALPDWTPASTCPQSPSLEDNRNTQRLTGSSSLMAWAPSVLTGLTFKDYLQLLACRT